MDKKEKQKLSESDICDLFITPAIKDAWWVGIDKARKYYPEGNGRLSRLLAMIMALQAGLEDGEPMQAVFRQVLLDSGKASS